MPLYEGISQYFKERVNMSKLTLTRNLIQATMQVVSCRTRQIMELKCLTDNEKRASIDDMICRQMRSLEMDSELELQFKELLEGNVVD
jgi:hypothetical protein